MASVVEPGSVDEVATLLRDASRDGLAVIPRGGGTKLDWGRPPRRADLVLSTVRLDRVLEHAWGDMTATVEAGCTVARLQHARAAPGAAVRAGARHSALAARFRVAASTGRSIGRAGARCGLRGDARGAGLAAGRAAAARCRCGTRRSSCRRVADPRGAVAGD